MRDRDEIQSRIDLLEAAVTALRNEGSQDDEENALAEAVIGALHWAQCRETPAANRVDKLVGRFDGNLKRLAARSKPAKTKRVPVASATEGAPW